VRWKQAVVCGLTLSVCVGLSSHILTQHHLRNVRYERPNGALRLSDVCDATNGCVCLTLHLHRHSDLP
jgi:hypothetical protein